MFPAFSSVIIWIHINTVSGSQRTKPPTCSLWVQTLTLPRRDAGQLCQSCGRGSERSGENTVVEKAGFSRCKRILCERQSISLILIKLIFPSPVSEEKLKVSIFAQFESAWLPWNNFWTEKLDSSIEMLCWKNSLYFPFSLITLQSTRKWVCSSLFPSGPFLYVLYKNLEQV